MLSLFVNKNSYGLSGDVYAQVDVYDFDLRDVDVEIIVEEDVVNRDINDDQPADNPTGLGMTLQEKITSLPQEQQSQVLLAFNGITGSFWTANSGVIVNGKLVTKPKGVKGLFQTKYFSN